jgi:HlyD family secretion protein
MFKKLLNTIRQHKIITGIIVVLIAGGGYFGYGQLNKSTAQASYVLATVQKGTIVVSVSGSGQVSASNQVDLKPKASADLTYVGVTNGQQIKAGTLIAQLNSQDAQKTIRDAQANLDTAKLSLEKLIQPADQLSILQAENALAQANQTKQNAQNDLTKAYEDGFNDISNVFLNLPSLMTGLNSLIFGYDFVSSSWNIYYYASASNNDKATQYRDDVYDKYNIALASYNKNFDDYKSTSRFSDTAAIESLINETYDSVKNIAETIKSTNNLIQFYVDQINGRGFKPVALASTHLATLSTYTNNTNTYLSNLLAAKTAVQNSKNTIVSADQSIAERTQSLAKLKAGADALDIQSTQLSVQQKQNALLDTQQKLADYSIRAPFDGVIANLNAKKGDSVSSATTIATLLTTQKIAEISLNEVDVAKVKVRQRVTLTFDAVADLTISGQVAQIDAIGTVAQGVVNYAVKISFDTQDERIKPAMSVSAAIVTDVKQDALLVPNAAVKSDSSGGSYVQILVNNVPQNQTVETGLTNDTMTEIISGVKESDKAITQTITSGSTSANSSSPTGSQTNTFRMPGLGGAVGGAGRD